MRGANPAPPESRLPSRIPEHVPGKYYYDRLGRRYPADETGQKIVRTTRPVGISTDGWRGLTASQRESIIAADLEKMKKKKRGDDGAPATPAVDNFEISEEAWKDIDAKYN